MTLKDPNSLVWPPTPRTPRAQVPDHITVPWGDQHWLPLALTRSVTLAIFRHQVCLRLFHPAGEKSGLDARLPTGERDTPSGPTEGLPTGKGVWEMGATSKERELGMTGWQLSQPEEGLCSCRPQ